MNAAEYWERRYLTGGNSGDGSYGPLAEFKAEVINGLIANHSIRSVIEFGCGDGNQQRLIQCEEYLGFDVSDRAVSLCRQISPERRFFQMDEYEGEFADMALSLDVIFHLTGDWQIYVKRLFLAATRCVVIYSTNLDYPPHPSAKHVRHRRFASQVPNNWRLAEYIPNRYPERSNSDFYVYLPTQNTAS